jgi:hypothetical protein
MKTLGLLSAAAALVWLLAPGPAAGEERPRLFLGWEELSAAELAAERGGESAELSNVDVIGMGADVRDNTVVNSTSGDNLVNGGAFAGTQGFSTIIQNSGNHVIIQNSTVVNLTITK